MSRRRLPTFLADNEPEALLRATATTRDRVLVFCLLYLGLRVAELCSLKVEHVNCRRKEVWIRLGKGSRDRCIPMPLVMAGPLRGWIGGRKSGYVFPSPRGGRLTTRAVQKLIKRLAVAAGLDGALEPRRFHPHKLRHAFCTRLFDAGVEVHAVRDLMGHSSIAVSDVYAHCTGDRLREAINRPYAP